MSLQVGGGRVESRTQILGGSSREPAGGAGAQQTAGLPSDGAGQGTPRQESSRKAAWPLTVVGGRVRLPVHSGQTWNWTVRRTRGCLNHPCLATSGMEAFGRVCLACLCGWGQAPAPWEVLQEPRVGYSGPWAVGVHSSSGGVGWAGHTPGPELGEPPGTHGHSSFTSSPQGCGLIAPHFSICPSLFPVPVAL